MSLQDPTSSCCHFRCAGLEVRVPVGEERFTEGLVEQKENNSPHGLVPPKM